MTSRVLTEAEAPHQVIKLLASPVARARQTWYLAARSETRPEQWTVATLWPESERDGTGSRCWGIRLRGAAEPRSSFQLLEAVKSRALESGCTALVTDAMDASDGFYPLLEPAGFAPLRDYRTVVASTLETFKALSMGQRFSTMQESGWEVSRPRRAELHLLVSAFWSELGQTPPHLLQLIEQPESAAPIDQTFVLRRQGMPVGATVARRLGRHIDVQAMVVHQRWRKHRAFSWFLAEFTSGWPLIADALTFSYPQDNSGMVDIARRISARSLRQQHDFVLRLDVHG